MENATGTVMDRSADMTIAFIWQGLLGAALAQKLAQAGYTVQGFVRETSVAVTGSNSSGGADVCVSGDTRVPAHTRLQMRSQREGFPV